MEVPEILKYGSVISVPLFGMITLFLLTKVSEDYSIHTHTISQSINYLSRTRYYFLFRVNFLVKSLLDLGFAIYILKSINISFASPIAFLLLTSAMLFGSLAYFIEGKYSTRHIIIVYTSGVLWAIGQVLLVQYLHSNFFRLITLILIIAPIILAFITLFLKKTNVYIQIICMSIWYLWILIFVFCYL